MSASNLIDVLIVWLIVGLSCTMIVILAYYAVADSVGERRFKEGWQAGIEYERERSKSRLAAPSDKT